MIPFLLFYFQACRGSKSDKGISFNGKSDNSSNDETDFVRNNRRLPIGADFLIYHSTNLGKHWFFNYKLSS